MAAINKKLFIEAMRKGDKQAFLTYLPQMAISQKGVFRILRANMKWKHDYILKTLFLKKNIWLSTYKHELLVRAIANQYEAGVKQALQKGANPNTLFRKKHPLTLACRFGNYAIDKLLLEYGANPNPQDYSFSTPMELALGKLDMELAGLLVRHGSIFDEKMMNYGLLTAAKADRFDLVDQFLLMGARFDNRAYFAICFVNPYVMPKVLKRDFSYNLRDDILNHFVFLAGSGHLTILQECLKYGRKRTTEDELTETLSAALYAASLSGRGDIVKYLLTQGAGINYIVKTNTAYDAAINKNHIQLAEFLRKQGAKSAVELR